MAGTVFGESDLDPTRAPRGKASSLQYRADGHRRVSLVLRRVTGSGAVIAWCLEELHRNSLRSAAGARADDMQDGVIGQVEHVA